MIRRIHMIESLGRGGFFNHSVEVVAGLQRLGVDVVLHTAADCEAAPENLPLCRCVVWHRTSSSRLVRRSRTTLRYVGRTLPHLSRVIKPDDVVHVQGTFGLTPEIISVAKLRRATVVCSPHNTFARDKSAGAGRVLGSMLRRADRILVYSDADVTVLGEQAGQVGRVPLVQWVPPVDREKAARWRQALAPGGGRLAIMPGYIRADKNADVFVRALAMMPGWRGAVVGEDLGSGADLERLIKELDAPVTTRFEYLTVDDFVALVASADVVAAPYRVASQSGVLSVAARLGVPRATAHVGGLGELATAVARDLTPASLRDALLAAAEIGAQPMVDSDAARRFLDEYQLARSARRHSADPVGRQST